MAWLEAYLYSESVTDDTLPSLTIDDTIVVTEGAATCYARLGEPKRFRSALATWQSELNAVLPGFYQLSYNPTTNRVTIVGTNAFSVVLAGNVAKILGFATASFGPGVSFTGTNPPVFIKQKTAYECAPADDAAKVELRSYRHARALAVGWGNVQLFDVGLVFRAADLGWVIPVGGADVTGYCLTGRVRVGPDSPSYSPTAPGGYIDGFIVRTSDLQSLGDDEDFITMRALVAVS
mgnify:FL=1